MPLKNLQATVEYPYKPHLVTIYLLSYWRGASSSTSDLNRLMPSVKRLDILKILQSTTQKLPSLQAWDSRAKEGQELKTSV